jgi:hypothetical protein
MSETKTIKTESHEYAFKIMDTIHGVGLFHEYASLIAEHADDATKVFKSFLDAEFEAENVSTEKALEMMLTGDSAFIRIAQFLGKTLSVSRLFELSSMLLADAKIDKEICDDKGMCGLFRSRPYEIYRALVYAIVANYGDMLPFLGAEDTTESPSQEEAVEAKS